MNRIQPFFMLLFILSLYLPALAQEKSGSIQGTVLDFSTDDPISEVLIRVEGTKIMTHTDQKGNFTVSGLAQGKYTLICIKRKYYSSVSDPIEVFAEKTSHVTLKMLTGDPEKYLYFSIGGITVTADRDLIPESHETIHKISAGEIEHMQATNLGDILDLIPGVERNDRPGLNNLSLVGLRGAETEKTYDRPDVFGTKIIVDDIPLSNNANMNTGTGVGYGAKVKTNAETGVDLRGLVADNVKEVEVISGVPSVEYGDLTSGIVKVTTRSDAQPLRLKAKSNPDTREVNLNGGNALGKHFLLSYNLNYAYSEKDIRQDGDEVSRVAGQFSLINNFPKKGLKISNRIRYSRLLENYSLPDDPHAVRAYNRGFRLSYGTMVNKKLSKRSTINFSGYLNYVLRKSYLREFEVINPTYLSNLMESGTVEAEDYLRAEPYFWEVKTDGKEYNLGLKLKFRHRAFWHKTVHNFLAGAEFTYDGNTGPGKQFDPLKPPNGATGLRPRSFDEVPGFNQLSLFLEDRISGKKFVSYTLTLGIRGEMYNPQRLGGRNLVESQNGTFWNPRMGLQLKLFKGLQLRSSYGITSKAPALLSIYPEPVYHDVVEWGKDPNDPTGQDSIPLITTYVYRLKNENLRGYKQRKFEIGIDYKFKNVGISVTGYRQKTMGTIVDVELPYTDRRYFWANWPSPEGKILRSENKIILSNYERKKNLGWNTRQGVEFTVKTHRIAPLNLMFRITGSYNFKRHGSDNYLDLDTPRQFTEITAGNDTIEHYAYPLYPPTTGWRKNLRVYYSIDYVNRALGIWITFTMYHKIYDKKQVVDLPSVYNYATGYYEDGKYHFISLEQAREMGLYSLVSPGEIAVFHMPSTYYFNLTVSKNIYQGMEVSLFVNNFLNQRKFYTNQFGIDEVANPEIFYGMEFSMMVDPLVKALFSRFHK